MFAHNKRLQYTVRVAGPNPGLANMVLEQFGGPQGELAEAADTEAEMYRKITGAGNDSHITQVLYGGGTPLVNSASVPWTAAYIDSITEPTADLRSNIAAEARAKIVYERLIALTDDPGVKEAPGFLMTREVAHQKSFEKALYSMESNFPPGKMPVDPRFFSVYFNMSQGPGEMRGPWNQGPQWDFITDREKQMAVDGGSGEAEVKLPADNIEVLKQMQARTLSDPTKDPQTGAELGLDPSTPKGASAVSKP